MPSYTFLGKKGLALGGSSVMINLFGDNTFLQRGSPPPPPWRLSPNFFFD
jgi:hypothetical protein